MRGCAFGKLRAVKSLAEVYCAVSLGVLCGVGSLSAKDGKLSGPAPNAASVLELRGKIVKLGSGTNSVAFKTESGVVYPLARNQKSEALFTDTNLSTKTLIVRGRLQPKTNLLEITANLYSLHDGKRFEIYYYCDICAIKTSEPGPCMCCREPVQLVEEPK